MDFRKALVTGGAGFIGSHLSEALLKLGIEVVVYDNLSVGSKENIPSKAYFVKGDILDRGTLLNSLKNVDVVFHLAAKVSIRASVDEFDEDARNNMMGTVNVLSCLQNSNVKKFIFASSMAVYADSPRPEPLSETHLQEPISPYGIAKLASEKYCLLISKKLGIDAIVLRYFNTYGVRQTFTPYVGVITIFINRLLKGKPLTIFGDGQQCRDFVHVQDIVDANILAMEHGKGNQILNLGTGQGTSVEQLAHLLRKKINPGSQIQYEPRRQEELRNSIADCSRARKSIHYAYKRDLSGHIDEVIEWNRHRASKPGFD
jgi:UDP-glucose 4-epimerase